jgi:hypothetical protein
MRQIRLTLATITTVLAVVTPAGALAGSMHHGSYCKSHHHLTHHQMAMHHCPSHSMHH